MWNEPKIQAIWLEDIYLILSVTLNVKKENLMQWTCSKHRLDDWILSVELN